MFSARYDDKSVLLLLLVLLYYHKIKALGSSLGALVLPQRRFGYFGNERAYLETLKNRTKGTYLLFGQIFNFNAELGITSRIINPEKFKF